ncbi:MAG: ABC transporter ATP-binding protein [Elusimicrobia bacterium]|nr:ABC transporter ATP-binding protein [Elusimicrobiota bacterium]
MTGAAAIRTENLTKRFGRDTVALADLNLEISEGEIFGLLGPNGAGKTTTIKLLTGLLKPTSGKVLIKGIDIMENPVGAKRKFALLPDVPYLYKKLTGWEFMKFVSKIYRIDRPGIDMEIDRQLRVFNIREIAHDLTESYSHGLRQRLLLASVMMRDPDIIILDEPMVGLDPQAARMVKDMFRKLADNNKTIFLSTHTLNDAQELCGKIAIIDRGRLIAQGTMDQLKETAGAGLESLEDIYLTITKDE